MTEEMDDLTRECLAQAELEARLLAPDEIPPEEVSDTIDSDFVRQCLDECQLGDGKLYAARHRGKFLHVKQWEKKPWLLWDGHHWKRDVMGKHITAVDDIAKIFESAAEDLTNPIERERELFQEASTRLETAKATLKDLGKNAAEAAKAPVIAEMKSAQEDCARHGGALRGLVSQQKDYRDRRDHLRKEKGVKETIYFAHHCERRLAIEGKELDQRPWLLACPNGVVDLKTGRLRPGRPSDYLLRTVAVPYPEDLKPEDIFHYLHSEDGLLPDGTSPHPMFDTFYDSIQPEESIRHFIQRHFGYAITGHSRLEQYIAIHIGLGRNGKGTLFDLILDIMGDLGWIIKPELLLEDKNGRSASAASPEIKMLQGRRFVMGEETDPHKAISESKVKGLTGGAKQNARGLFDGEEDLITPTHTLFLATQNIPVGLTKDFALIQRLLIVDYPYLFVEDPAEEARKAPHLADKFRKRDKGLFERLLAERSRILLWLIRGCLMWQKAGGLKPPDSIKLRIAELQIQEDTLQRFLNNCCAVDWNSERTYAEGEYCNLPGDRPDVDTGTLYKSTRADNKGNHPRNGSDPGAWNLAYGTGIDPQGWIPFKKFYGDPKTAAKEDDDPTFVHWYFDNVSDSTKYLLSKTALAKQLRAKGFDLRTVGGQTRIYGGLKIVGGAL